MRSTILAALAATACLAAPALVATTTDAEASSRLIRRCTATGQSDISMQARYEVRGSRRKFKVEFEAGPTAGFSAGQMMTFTVAGDAVGRDALQTIVGGDLIAGLEFDSKADDPDEQPFPQNFPTIGNGTVVQVKGPTGTVVLGCTLR